MRSAPAIGVQQVQGHQERSLANITPCPPLLWGLRADVQNLENGMGGTLPVVPLATSAYICFPHHVGTLPATVRTVFPSRAHAGSTKPSRPLTPAEAHYRIRITQMRHPWTSAGG